MRIQGYIYLKMCVHGCNISGKIQGNESIWLSLMEADGRVAFGGRETDFLSTLPFCSVGSFLTCVCVVQF